MLPVVLHHGFCGCPGTKIGPIRITYFHRIDTALAEQGHPLIQTRVHPTAGIADRAAQLKDQILAGLDRLGRPDDRVIVIGHSMGGLDARYMIGKLGMAGRVAALLSITTPHRGSPFADWAARNLGRRLKVFKLVEKLGLNVQAVRDLTTESCRGCIDEVPDAAGVRYFSTGAARPWHLVPAFAVPAHKIITDAEGPNDALVSVKSSAWGTHLGVWPADHWHTINRRLVVEFKHPTGDLAPYYQSALDQVVAAL